ncbi:uncharacterized protein LOC141527063 isoform X2 [Cotesia typhae]|uniref:uncharacterized protein LOC141527063 isoform X2 n=1 Tax=Cotesia typhae TaxID=2053667 RepID=UPI003D69530E
MVNTRRSLTPEISAEALKQIGQSQHRLPLKNVVEQDKKSQLLAPEISGATNNDDSLPPNKQSKSIVATQKLSANTSEKRGVGIPAAKKIVLQSKDGPEILSLLKEAYKLLETINTKVTEQDKKIEQHSKHLEEVKQIIGTFQFATAGGGFEKPPFIPFKKYDELKNYDKFTDEERAKLKKWVLFFNRRTNVTENVREILQGNRLITDELLQNMVWEGAKGRESTKQTISRRRVIYDIQKVFSEMYPTMTDIEFKIAVQKGLKAAYSRVDQRKKQKRKQGGNDKKRRKMSDAEFFHNQWISSSDTDEENEEKDENKNN